MNYAWKTYDRRAVKAANRPVVKQGREAIEAALSAHGRIMELSTEIRQRFNAENGYGPDHYPGLMLEPLDDGETVKSWRIALESKGKRKAPAKRKAELSPVDQVADIARRRRALDREREALDAEIVAVVEARSVPVAKIASALGVSRQRVYLAAA